MIDRKCIEIQIKEMRGIMLSNAVEKYRLAIIDFEKQNGKQCLIKRPSNHLKLKSKRVKK